MLWKKAFGRHATSSRSSARGNSRSSGFRGCRRASFEPLEQRQLLAIDVAWNAGELSAIDNAGEENELRISLVGDQIELSDAAGVSPDGNQTFFNGTDTVRYAAADATSIRVRLVDGDDVLTVDFNGGDVVPSGGFRYSGGFGDDELVVIGDGFANVTSRPHGFFESDGTIEVGGSTIEYDSLEPIVISRTPQFTLVTANDADDLLVENPGPGITQISGTSDGTGFETHYLYNVGSITIDGVTNDLGGADSVLFEGNWGRFGGIPGVVEETQPNFDVADADPLEANEYGRGALSYPGDVDHFKASADLDDLVFTYVDTQHSETGRNSVLTLIANDETTIIESDDDDGPFASSVIAGAVVPESGDVFYKVTGSQGEMISRYELYQVVVDPGDVASGSGSNDTPQTASPVIATMMEGRVPSGSGDVDYFSFFAPAGSTVAVIVDDDPDNDGDFTDTELSIVAPDGTTTLADGDDNSFRNGNAAGAVAVTVSGTYYVRIENGDDSTVHVDSDYRFVVVVLDPADSDPLGLFDVDVDTGTGDDTLTFDFTNGHPIPVGGIDFNAGGPGNNGQIVVQGGALSRVAYDANGPGEGDIFFRRGSTTGTAVFQHVELISVFSEVATLDVDIRDGDTGHSIEIKNEGPVDNGMNQVTFDGDLAGIRFTNPTELLDFDANDGIDVITLKPLDNDFKAGIDIRGGEGNDIVRIEATPVGTRTEVDTEIGPDDMIIVGENGSLDNILGDVAVTDSGGVAKLIIDDSAEKTGRSLEIRNSNLVKGSDAFGPYDAEVRDLDLFLGSIFYDADSIETLTIKTGTGDDEVTVNYDDFSILPFDFADPIPEGGLFWEAGADGAFLSGSGEANTLVLTGGVWIDAATYTATGRDTGNLSVDDNLFDPDTSNITFSAVTNVFDSTTTADRTFNDETPGDHCLIYGDEEGVFLILAANGIVVPVGSTADFDVIGDPRIFTPGITNGFAPWEFKAAFDPPQFAEPDTFFTINSGDDGDDHDHIMLAPGNIDSVSAFGNEGLDQFVLWPTANMVTIDGGNPPPGSVPGDSLVLPLGGTITPTLNIPGLLGLAGTVDFSSLSPLFVGLPPANFTNIEHFITPDRFERNDSIIEATILGSDTSIIERDLSISSSLDRDIFEVRAHDTGVLKIDISFLHAIGDLDMRVLDASGNVIAEAFSIDDDENLIIPVVTQETYYVEVLPAGAVGAKVLDPTECFYIANNYSLEIENFPAPLVDFVDLPAKDQHEKLNDTGRSQFDNVTRREDVEILIEADLNAFAADGIAILDPADPAFGTTPGAAVAVYLNDNILVGYATPVLNPPFLDPPDPPGVPSTTLFRFTFPAHDKWPAHPELWADSGGHLHYVKGAVEIFDGQKANVSGRTQLSEPLQLVIDTKVPAASVANLLASSDSGRFNNDNVTNIATPAFDGTAEHNAKIRIFALDTTTAPAAPAPWELVGEGFVGSDLTENGVKQVGSWEVTVEPLDDHANDATHYAKYAIITEVEDLAGNITRLARAKELSIWIDTFEPNIPYLDLVDASDTGRHNQDNVTKDNTLTVTSTVDDTPTGDGNAKPNTIIYRIFDRPDPVQFGATAVKGEELLIDSFVSQPGFSEKGYFTDTLKALLDGVHNLKLEVEDLAGNLSHDYLLTVTIDTEAPAKPTLAIDPATSDTGVAGQPDTIVDRITSDSETGFVGQAEADAIVRMWADGPDVSDGVVDGSDVFQGLTVAIPLDGNLAFPSGQWNLAGQYDLNDPTVGFPLDGLRQIGVDAKDLAGNVSEPAFLDIFIDTQGPQVIELLHTDAPGYALFDPKPSVDGPTPLVNAITVVLEDPPPRLVELGKLGPAQFKYGAVNAILAAELGNYSVVGDASGVIDIKSVKLEELILDDDRMVAVVTLNFSTPDHLTPLPDDRYTLTVFDRITDDVGNALDGESNTAGPTESPTFATGDGVPGADFTARFTVDSRPEVGTWAAGSVYIDTNGNFQFDPQNADATNRDIVYALGFTSDHIFAGNFQLPDAAGTADGFDKLAAYGKVGNSFRWLIDTDNDGQPDLAVNDPANIIGIPVAGRFDDSDLNGDEVGLFTGDTWWFDTDRSFTVDYSLVSQLRGLPIVGDFDGDGFDDLATWNNDHFEFDLANGAPRGWDGTVDATIALTRFAGFIGVRERPVAADMDGDGIDDVGLWVPDRSGATPEKIGEWYLLLSDDLNQTKRQDGAVVTLDHEFTPIPFGPDIFAQFGDEFAIPVVGNFDPPTTGGGDGDAGPVFVTLSGTEGDDEVEFSPGAEPGTWSVSINGDRQDLVADSVRVEFDGLGGYDTVTVIGTDGEDLAELRVGGGDFTGDGYSVTLVNVEAITVDGRGGIDVAKIRDSAGDDVFEAGPGWGSFTGPGISHSVSNFEFIHAYSTNGGDDLAQLHGSAGNDKFKATAAYAKVYNSEFYNRAKFFATVVADAGSGGVDLLRIWDSPGNDIFVGTPDEVHFYNEAGGFDITALAFDEVLARSTTGGYDKASLYDSPGKDVFRGRPHKSTFVGPGLDFTVRQFEEVHVYAENGGNDIAKMHDTLGDDLLEVADGWAQLSINEGEMQMLYEAVAFERVKAYHSSGNDSVKTTAATDILMLEGEWTYLP